MLAWERQENESARAFEAFAVYRDLGAQRSIAKVAEILGKSRALLERWSTKHDWVARCQALEARDEMLRREAIEAHLQAKAKDYAEREAALREQALEIREVAAEQALRMLQWPLTEQRAVQEDEEGRPVQLVFVPARWTKSTAKSLYDMAIGHQQLEEDEEDEDHFDFSELSTDELRTLVELSSKIQVRRPGSG
jgi:hypothetical protein